MKFRVVDVHSRSELTVCCYRRFGPEHIADDDAVAFAERPLLSVASCDVAKCLMKEMILLLSV